MSLDFDFLSPEFKELNYPDIRVQEVGRRKIGSLYFQTLYKKVCL